MKKFCLLILAISFCLSSYAQYVDLGLPSGTKWKSSNETGGNNGYYTYDAAVKAFIKNLPTKEHWVELYYFCKWEWQKDYKAYKVTGPNGNSIVLPAEGISRGCGDGGLFMVGLYGGYWSSTPNGSENAWRFFFNWDMEMHMHDNSRRCNGLSVRLIQEPPRQYVDLGLPSGTKWASINEVGLYSYYDAVNKYGNKLPTKEQLEELKDNCKWTWTGKDYKVTGPNGKSIVLPASGYRNCGGVDKQVGSNGYYWSSAPNGSSYAWHLAFYSVGVDMGDDSRCYGHSVRLVQDSPRQNTDSGLPSGTTGTVKNENVSNNSELSRQFVDLGLPSGTKWKSKNEDGLYNYDDAVKNFGNELPTKEQFEELKDKCKWEWLRDKKAYKVTGLNGNFIVLPAPGYRDCYGDVCCVGSDGFYWSSAPTRSFEAWGLDINSNVVRMSDYYRCIGRSVRLVQK